MILEDVTLRLYDGNDFQLLPYLILTQCLNKKNEFWALMTMNCGVPLELDLFQTLDGAEAAEFIS